MQNPLWRRDFLTLWSGSTASGFATWGLTFLMGMAAAMGEIGAVLLGTILALRTVGFLIGVLFGGIAADRFTRRGVVLWASLLATLGVGLVAAGVMPEGTNTALLITGAILSGLGQGACRPAYQALVPLIIRPENRQAANAAMGLSVRIVTLIGPAATGAIAAFVGLGISFGLLAVIWLISAFAPPYPATDRPAQSSGASGTSWLGKLRHDLGEGLAEARRHPWFMASLAALTATIAAGYSASSVILPLISEVRFGGPRLLVWSMTAYTAGGIAGALIVGRVQLRPIGWWALAGMGCYGLVMFSLLPDSGLALPMAAYVVAGMGIEIFNTLWFTAIQNEVAAERLARVSSLDFLASYGLAPLGLAIVAPLARTFGTEPVLVVCGVICLIAPALAAMVRSSRTYSVQG